MDAMIDVGGIHLSGMLVITLLGGLVGGVWRMSAQLTKIEGALNSGNKRMNRHEKLISNHASRLNRLDGKTDPIFEDE